jgi:hypothetical protein
MRTARPTQSGQDREQARKRRADTEARLARFTAAIKAGIDPAAQAVLENAPAPGAITEAEVHAMIDSLGDVGAALIDGKPESLAEIYELANLQICYEPDTNFVATPPCWINALLTRTGTGDRLEARVEVNRGGLGNPLSDDELATTFHLNAYPAGWRGAGYRLPTV